MAAVHIKSVAADLHAAGASDARRQLADLQVVAEVEAALAVSTEKMSEVVVSMLAAMAAGLAGEESTLKMLPSFVHRPDAPDAVRGSFMALDLGGTNFRVMNVTVEAGRVVKQRIRAHHIPAELMRADAAAAALFDFVAGCVADDVRANVDAADAARIPLGFTFSFPVQQTRVDAGTLIAWTKGFATPGVEGEDVVELLKAALARKGVTNIDVTALVNDTVGTLVTGCFAHDAAEVCVILGTGTNACYWEDEKHIAALADAGAGGNATAERAWARKMCVNMEWGNFGSDGKGVLPMTDMDTAIDAASPNPGKQLFEKMMSGMYLGDIARLIIDRMAKRGALPTFPQPIAPQSFTSAHLSLVLGDASKDLKETVGLLRTLYSVEVSPVQAANLKRALAAVLRRSARLAAAGIAAVLLKAGKTDRATICIDGSVFEKAPGYRQLLNAALAEVLHANGVTDAGYTVVHTGNGSGLGAAYIAALAQ